MEVAVTVSGNFTGGIRPGDDLMGCVVTEAGEGSAVRSEDAEEIDAVAGVKIAVGPHEDGRGGGCRPALDDVRRMPEAVAEVTKTIGPIVGKNLSHCSGQGACSFVIGIGVGFAGVIIPGHRARGLSVGAAEGT